MGPAFEITEMMRVILKMIQSCHSKMNCTRPIYQQLVRTSFKIDLSVGNRQRILKTVYIFSTVRRYKCLFDCRFAYHHKGQRIYDFRTLRHVAALTNLIHHPKLYVYWSFSKHDFILYLIMGAIFPLLHIVMFIKWQPRAKIKVR